MFDQSMYTNILNAAYQILRNNGNQLGRQFCEGFMVDHDPSQGQSSMRNAQQFFDYVANEAQRQNGSMTIRSDAQLGDIVGTYIQNLFHMWSQRQGGGNFGGGFNSGGFGNSRPMGAVFGNNNQLGFGQQRPANPGLRTDDVIEPTGSQQQTIQPQQASAPQQTLNMSVDPLGAKNMANYAYNPLDDIPEQGIELHGVPESPWWGYDLPKDNSIKIANKTLFKSGDMKYVITVCDGVDQTFYNDPMDVISNFIHTVPDSFTAEHFIFKVSYNHLEKLDVPTHVFIKVAEDLIRDVGNERIPLMDALKNALDPLPYGYHKVIVKYLLERINKGLYTSWRYASNPGFVCKMTELEDISYLLGPEAKLAILNEPHAKHNLISIIRTAVINSVYGYSKILFDNKEDVDYAVIKQSPLFPESMSKIYSSKSIIPDRDHEDFPRFVEQWEQKELSSHTYIRQIRSIIFTNVLGGKALSTIGKDPSVVEGQIPSMFSVYVPVYMDPKRVAKDRVSNYDTLNDDVSYADYLEDSDKEDTGVFNRFNGTEPPETPVDQTLVLFQFKEKPENYLLTTDICTMVTASARVSAVLLAKKPLPVLVPTNR